MKLNISKVKFDEAAHTYVLDGKPLSGITSLIHQVLNLGVYPEASDFVKHVAIPRAGEYGSSIHKAIELYDELGIKQTLYPGKYGTWEVSDELESYIKAKQGYKTIANEYTVSDDVRYASQIDNIWLNEETGGVWIFDTKSNNLDYYPGGENALKEYLSWQESIYAYLFEKQNPGIKVEGLGCNWLRKGESRQWIIERKPDEQVELLLSVEWIKTDCGIVYDGDEVAAKLLGNAVATQPKQELLAQAIVQQIFQVEKAAKEAEAVSKELRVKLREAMENAGVKSWDAELFKATISADSVSTVFDTTRFKKDHPERYKEYSKKTERKGTLTIKLREN